MLIIIISNVECIIIIRFFEGISLIVCVIFDNFIGLMLINTETNSTSAYCSRVTAVIFILQIIIVIIWHWMNVARIIIGIMMTSIIEVICALGLLIIPIVIVIKITLIIVISSRINLLSMVYWELILWNN